jgi:DNA-binding transcriptional MerR regulator
MNIGELAKLSGLAASRIRFYETEGLLQVERQANGYRHYPAQALQTLQLIQGAQQAGFTLQELKALLPGAAPAEGGHAHMVSSLERKVQQIEAMQQQLARSKAQLLQIIETVRSQPEGMPCAQGRERVLASIKSASASTADQ